MGYIRLRLGGVEEPDNRYAGQASMFPTRSEQVTGDRLYQRS